MPDVALESTRYPWISSLAALHAIPLLGSPTLRRWDVALKCLDLFIFLPTALQEKYEVQADHSDAPKVVHNETRYRVLL